MYLAMLLADFGYTVCGTADTASGAIEQAVDHRPDLVLTDIRLANGSSGIDAARELHARHGRNPPTKAAVGPIFGVRVLGTARLVS